MGFRLSSQADTYASTVFHCEILNSESVFEDLNHGQRRSSIHTDTQIHTHTHNRAAGVRQFLSR